MKLIAFLIFLLTAISVFSQKNKAIFLVHSTGSNLFSEGKVADWVKTYNSANGTDFQITTRSYPNTPWPWENYPYDYWKLWVDKSCNNANSNIECLASIAKDYDLVIFKHCFPGAEIDPDTGKPNIASNRKSLENYKLQYRALRTLMDEMPDKKFMVLTLVPLHRLSVSAECAMRANEFVNWVKKQWLTEDGRKHSNIFIFDFFSLAAEMNENPAKGKQFCLKYDYESNHTSDDSHPNTLAYQTIGPAFAQAVVKALSTNNSATSMVENIHISNPNFKIYPNPTMDKIQVQIDQMSNDGAIVELRNSTGQMLLRRRVTENLSDWPLDQYKANLYFVAIIDKEKIFTQKIVLLHKNP